VRSIVCNQGLRDCCKLHWLCSAVEASEEQERSLPGRSSVARLRGSKNSVYFRGDPFNLNSEPVGVLNSTTRYAVTEHEC
jgi:hypothetical protein